MHCCWHTMGRHAPIRRTAGSSPPNKPDVLLGSEFDLCRRRHCNNAQVFGPDVSLRPLVAGSRPSSCADMLTEGCCCMYSRRPPTCRPGS